MFVRSRDVWPPTASDVTDVT